MNRRTEVALKAIEASAAADKHHYDYHCEKLRTNSKERRERFYSHLILTWVIGGVVTSLALFVVLMLFLGSEPQQQMALAVLRTAGTGVGGAGVAWMLRSLILRITRDNRSD